MEKQPVNYQNQKEYITITAGTAAFKTACTSITFENHGTTAADLVLSSGKGTLRLEPGKVVSYNNPPDTLENNQYAISFDGAGTNKLFITKEHVFRVYGGESKSLPTRDLPVPIGDLPAQD